jgi:prepilin-type N-terminal cleavage/methylation domain-containing protein
MFITIRHRLQTGREGGFTLIELLIVIVILGILAGIVTFGVAQFRGDASNSCTAANQKIVDTANTAYQAKFPGSPVQTGAQLHAAGYLQDTPGAC